MSIGKIMDSDIKNIYYSLLSKEGDYYDTYQRGNVIKILQDTYLIFPYAGSIQGIDVQYWSFLF